MDSILSWKRFQLTVLAERLQERSILVESDDSLIAIAITDEHNSSRCHGYVGRFAEMSLIGAGHETITEN